MLSRKTLLLKPMQPAVSGYARLQLENGRMLAQVHARGLKDAAVRLFAYLDGHAMSELGGARVNASGEASVETEAPAGTKGLLVVGAPPRPLLIGLTNAQTSGELLDARNAALALCERLSAKPAREEARPRQAAKPDRRAAPELPAALPREIFLPAIDPAPYVAATARETLSAPKPVSTPRAPVDRLRPLEWPEGFGVLRPYFETRLPVALLPLPGWRFVNAADGLWLGRLALDGRVRRVAYAALRPPRTGGAQCVRGLDGQRYYVLFQTI